MIRRAILAIVLVAIAGCSTGMRNDDIIAETKYCHDAGFDVQVLRNNDTGEIWRIQCVPKESK